MRRTNTQEQTIRIGRRGVLLGTREVIHARPYGRTLGIGNSKRSGSAGAACSSARAR
jgi:hypothetical protein